MSTLAQYKAKSSNPSPTVINSSAAVVIDGVQFDKRQIKALEKAGVDLFGGAQDNTRRTFKNDPASTTLTAPALQGAFQGNANQYGLLTAPGVRPERFANIPRPLTFMRLLTEQGALQRSEYINEVLEIFTGATDGAGTNATGFCGNPPTAGQLMVMQRVFKFGQWYMKSNLNAVPLIGRLRSRADVPGRILNAGPEANPLIPDIMYQLNDTRSQLQYELFMIGVQNERGLEKVGVGGNSALASTSTNLGWISEFDGLDLQIKTGYTDAVSGALANAADSISENWGNQLVGGTQSSTGRNIVQIFADTYYALQQNAARVGMEGYEQAIMMRSEFFRALTDVYACSYATARCTNGAVGTPQIVDQTVINNLRLEMLGGQYLLIEGVKVPVVFSDGMQFSHVGTNQWVTGVYFVPISWAGRPLLRMEYFPMDNPYATEYYSFLNAERYRILNNGMYLVGYRSTGMCDEYHFASSSRLILETPFLAARIDNINFTYNAQTESAYPGETTLYKNGGVSYRTPFYNGQ